MKSFATPPAANCQISPVRILLSDRRSRLASRHHVTDGQQTGEARSLVSRHRQRLQSRCCSGSATVRSRHMASTKASDWTSSRSVTDHSLATVFRWPGAFGSQAVSVLGNSCCSSAVGKVVRLQLQSIDVAARQVPLTTGRSLFLFRSPVELATGLSV